MVYEHLNQSVKWSEMYFGVMSSLGKKNNLDTGEQGCTTYYSSTSLVQHTVDDSTLYSLFRNIVITLDLIALRFFDILTYTTSFSVLLCGCLILILMYPVSWDQ